MTGPQNRTWPALALALLLALSTAACGFCNPEEDAGEGEAEEPKNSGEDKDEDGAKKADADAVKDKKPPRRADAKTPRSVRDKKAALKNKNSAARKPALSDKIKRPALKNVGKLAAGPQLDFTKDGALGNKKSKLAAPTSPGATKLEDAAPKKPKNTSTDLASALTRGEVRQATGYRSMLRPGPLSGIDADKAYDALRLRPTDRNKFGVALQVWREKNPGAQSRKFNDLLRQYPGSKRTRDLGDTSFKAEWGGLSYIVWLDRKNKLIAAISCDSDVCKDDSAALKLAERVATKLR